MKGATMHRLIDLGVDSSRNLRVRMQPSGCSSGQCMPIATPASQSIARSGDDFSRACRSPSRHWSANGWHIGSEPELRRKPWRSAEPGLSETQQ